MNLDRVTITGADDTTDPKWMAGVTTLYPFVEWGILLSESQEGTPRFPSTAWIENLRQYPELRLSGHLCGKWVRQLMVGNARFQRERQTIANLFPRMQLNFHGDEHPVDVRALGLVIDRWGKDRKLQIILQMDGVNDWILQQLVATGLDVVPLFDTSGGAGIYPANWPAPYGDYSGYAGGLHPDKLVDQMGPIIKAARGSRIWIDVETHIMDAANHPSPLRVVSFLEAAAWYVNPAALKR